MANLLEGLTTIGSGVKDFITGPETLYATYFFVFLFGTFALLNALFQKQKVLEMFKGKPGKVISFMISIITTGAIFYGSKQGNPRSMEELLYLFNGLGGFLITLVFSVGFAFWGFQLFKKNKENNFNLAMIFLTAGLYIASTLLMPAFISDSINIQEGIFLDITEENMYGETAPGHKIYDTWKIPNGYMGNMGKGRFDVIYHTLDYIALFSGIALVIYIIILGLNSIKGDNPSNSNSNSVSDKNSERHEKRIKDFQGLLRALSNELKETNNHFNNKVNILNELRSEIGRLRNLDKGGRK